MNKISLCFLLSFCTIIPLVYSAESSDSATARAAERQACKREYEACNLYFYDLCQTLARTKTIPTGFTKAAYDHYEASRKHHGKNHAITKATRRIWEELFSPDTREVTLAIIALTTAGRTSRAGSGKLA